MNAMCRKKKQTQTLTVVVPVGIVMLAGAILWILSLEGLVTGSWANMMSVIFTFLGVLYGLLQWLAQLGEQQAKDMSGPLSDISDALVQDQRYHEAESLISRIISSPLTEVPSSSTPLPSVIDSRPTPVASTMNDDRQDGSLSKAA